MELLVKAFYQMVTIFYSMIENAQNKQMVEKKSKWFKKIKGIPKKKEEIEKHSTLKKKNEIEQTTLTKSQPEENELHVEYSKAKRKSIKRCFIMLMEKM